MNFSDQAIVISKKPLKENSYIITVLTHNHGIYSGVLKQSSKATKTLLLEGSLVDFTWSARLHEHVGYVKIELIKSYNACLLSNKTKLYAFNSITSLLKLAFCEREPHNNLFPALLSFLKSLKSDFCFKKYFSLELDILAEAGYRLQLDSCVATGVRNNLYYVSPKSGRAVCKEAGMQYADKLLKLPNFLLPDINSIKIGEREILEAIELTSYFINRYVIMHKKPLLARQIFLSHISEINSAAMQIAVS